MTPVERQSAIVDLVRQQARVSVDALAKRFDASPETIRRDLARLSRTGKVLKVHGGAILPRSPGEGPFSERMWLNMAAKRRIAQHALALVDPGDSLMIDTGSTTVVFAEELATVDDLTVITNSAEVARATSNANATAQVYLLGGAYRAGNRQTCGTMAVSQLQNFRVDKVILTVGAVDANAGVMDFNPEEAEIARAMIARAQSVIVLADSSKFGRTACFSVAPFETIDHLVTDQLPARPLAAVLARNDVNVIC